MTVPPQPSEVSTLSHPRGLVVVLCGPDGSGKSTIAKSLILSLSAIYRPGEGLHCHWKPWLSRKTTGNPEVTRPHEQKPRNVIASIGYFGYHWLGFFWGMLFNVPRYTRRGGLVVIERFYYDFFVDLRRYRLRVPQLLVRCGCRLLPRPDLVFLLDAPPETLQRRKQEVPLLETVRQRNAYRDLVSGLSNGRIIDATQSLDAVNRIIVEQILQFSARKAGAGGARSNPFPVHGPAQGPNAERKEV